MITFQKNPNKDFVILNISDPQLGAPEWEEGHVNRKILEHTLSELVNRANPDLITVSGDLAWAGQDHAYAMFGALMESFQTPWAIVWGNHDNQNGAEFIEKIVNRYLELPHFVYEKGNPAFGNGNYVIGIEENGKLVESIFMLDSHDKLAHVAEDGTVNQAWSKVYPEQVSWLREQSNAIKSQGCKDGILILHIPIYAYKLASKAAYEQEGDAHADITLEDSYKGVGWRKGYENSVGVQFEGISCYPEEDGVFDAIKDVGLIKHVIAGHDHVNNWIINHEGVKLIFALKAGPGCYWNPVLNGGTVLKVNQNGVFDAYHEYVDISAFLE